MSERIHKFFKDKNPATPCLVVDSEIVRKNYNSLKAALPFATIFYAIKANPEMKILSLLAEEGSHFDCASIAEIEMVLATGAAPHRISFGNTIKKHDDIKKAFDLGIRQFATDSHEDLQAISRAAPGSDIYCRILTSGEGADWPLSRKFGCDVDTAVEILTTAKMMGLTPRGISFHVGSQMTRADGWDDALQEAKAVFDRCADNGLKLELINLGGGFPTRYLKDVPSNAEIGAAIEQALARVFKDNIPAIIVEPGRGMVGNAGIIKSEVILASKKSKNDPHRWVYLDIGKFGGLAETMDEAIRYPIRTEKDGTETTPSIIAGPTCDSVDVLYEKKPYDLPLVEAGDFVFIEGTGAYTTTYSSVSFNGFAPLKAYVI